MTRAAQENVDSGAGNKIAAIDPTGLLGDWRLTLRSERGQIARVEQGTLLWNANGFTTRAARIPIAA